MHAYTTCMYVALDMTYDLLIASNRIENEKYG